MANTTRDMTFPLFLIKEINCPNEAAADKTSKRGVQSSLIAFHRLRSELSQWNVKFSITVAIAVKLPARVPDKHRGTLSDA